VTGGAQGIGQAYSERLAREGAAVGIVDLRADQAQAVAAGIRESGGRAVAHSADVSNQDEMDNAVAQVIAEFGRVDVLINNAAIYGDIDWSDNSLEYLRKVLDVNLIGILVCCRAVFPAMKRQRGGSIINISSIAAYPWPWGRTRDPDALEYLNATADERRTWSWEPAQDLETIPSSAYGLGKWGVVYYTRAFARSLGVYGIRVNAIAPGAVLTDATIGVLRGLPRAEAMERIASDNLFATFINVAALRRLVEPTDLAGVAAFLASDDAAMITGQVLVVDAGIEMRS
jgi:NAD(P)-dependent dehydrogenase (short-subunit alcohol dehydrogenase family)